METKITLEYGEQVEFGILNDVAPHITIVNEERQELLYLTKSDIIQLRDFLNQLDIK